MLLLLISVTVCIIVILAVDYIVTFIKNLRLEKVFKERVDNANVARRRGISGNLLFIAEKIGNYVEKKKIKQLEPMLEKIIQDSRIMGGFYDTISPYTFVGIQAIAGCFLVFFIAVLLDVYNPVLWLPIFAIGFFIPYLLLGEQVKAKHRAFFRQLPDMLDLLCLMMEAGLDFNSALSRIIDAEKGELSDEFHIAQQEIRLGKARNDAFNEMAERIKHPSVTSVIRSLTLAFNTGGSLVPTLKALSGQFRLERMQLAEKTANEAPLKLMAPLLLLIFPTIFMVLFGPIILMFMNGGF
jgi:tight adherence protein C